MLSETVSEPIVRGLSEVLSKYYKGKLNRSDATDPLSEMTRYVYKARKAGLDKRECAYAGSLLVYETLRKTGRRFASDVGEVNELSLAGVKLARAIWDKLEALEKTPSGNEDHAFETMVQQMSDLLFVEYLVKSSTTVQEVVKR